MSDLRSTSLRGRGGCQPLLDACSKERLEFARLRPERPGQWPAVWAFVPFLKLAYKNGQFCPLTWDFRNDLSSCAAFYGQRAWDDGATTRDFPSPAWALRQQI